jgi:hypothetical protein
MKKLWIAAVLALGVCGNALALNYIGPPTTRMEAGQWAVGASFSHSLQDIKYDGHRFDNAEQDVVVGRVAVGLVTSRLEISGLAGAADFEGGSLDTDYTFLLGGAFRATLWKGQNLDWGVVGQGTFMSTEDTGSRTVDELKLGEVLFGLGPCWRPDWGIVYGGALVHVITGTLKTVADEEYDLEQDSPFGAYLGGGIELERHLMATAEVQATPDAYGWGVGLLWRF